MNIAHEKADVTTCEWYTPKNIIQSLGEFDLDPASPLVRVRDTAKKHYDILDDGLSQVWKGRGWLNPPYSRPEIEQFMKRMAEHGNGVALVFSRCDTIWFQEYVLKRASAILFMKGRIAFIQPNGKPLGRSGAGSALIAYGSENVKALEKCGLDGQIVYL